MIFMKPDRVVVGVESEKAKAIMERLYKPFMMNNYRLIFTDIPSAEMIKICGKFLCWLHGLAL